jgi:hypothetical protein
VQRLIGSAVFAGVPADFMFAANLMPKTGIG